MSETSRACPIGIFVSVIDGPWATLIVRELLSGPKRFGDLRTALPGISPKTLTARLNRFTSLGLATRTAYPEIPPRVVYELTDRGRGLRPVLDAMAHWAEANLPIPDEVSEHSAGSVEKMLPMSR
ncbi:helix-turn-helix domain-containing protein [Nocardia ninae]|uniref:Transcriptional regulator n=1 Tax=Nocardia ninae NBRC 108245 TaxID=1210091 RepID=A0A511MVY8_9NOCA|nr:helix-turn-helix domain-containing protein [Nocardia ninae]GEM44276.1 transcriptional regulator [Nocardia ninae NBRC 108245]